MGKSAAAAVALPCPLAGALLAAPLALPLRRRTARTAGSRPAALGRPARARGALRGGEEFRDEVPEPESEAAAGLLPSLCSPCKHHQRSQMTQALQGSSCQTVRMEALCAFWLKAEGSSMLC